MKWIRVWVCVVACAGWFSARPASAASGPIRSQGRDRYELSAKKILVTGTARANLTPFRFNRHEPGRRHCAG